MSDILWSGQFGDEYTDRNQEIPSRRDFWSKTIPGDVFSAFEIGCNSGANLEAIQNLDIMVSGCDVNLKAVEMARAKGLDVIHANGLAVSQRADFVFTSGVLIHLQTPELIQLMKRMRKLSMRYVAFNEYWSEYDEVIPYRGHEHALYKRDFGRIYESLFPTDTLCYQSFSGKEEGNDNTTVWVYVI